jgi:putative FmdB family regulatory protein
MPTYEYACQKCGHEFEQFQSMLDEPLKKCPKCKKAALKRLVGGGAGLIFKGTGFYITDYKNKSGKPEGGGDKPGGEKQSGDKPAGEKKPGGEGKSAESKPSTSDSKPAASSSTNPKSSSDSARK